MVAQECERIHTERFEGGMAEISLLVPTWQIDILSRVAEEEGMTLAQYLRRVVHRCVRQNATTEELHAR